METISRLPRRLTQLYSDTKTSCDAVIEQDTPEAQPEVNALHRKYRIQKDRLIAWGLEWTDNTKGKQGDIDESVERAGLTETVTSVLGTIKDILDEAERMHPPAAHAGAKTLSGEKGGRPSDGPSWAASDRSRYEDLAKDLTTSIDILYDLSRSRRVQREGVHIHNTSTKAERPAATSVFLSSEYNASDVTLINPATIPVLQPAPIVHSHNSLPPKLDPSDLILPQEDPPPYESVGASSSIRVIGRLRSRHSSTNPWKTDGSKTVETPVLVEYAAFDPTYRFTEVTPSLDRLETLLSILTRLANEQSFHGTLSCLGYFEDPKQPRFGLVFELPSFVYSGPSDANKSADDLRPVTLLSVLQTGSKSLHSSNSATPPLEDRFRLAFTLALTFSKIHEDRFVHKDVNSSNILVFRKNRRQSMNSRALQYTLRSPVICSFDLFSEFDIEKSSAMPQLNIYRHPGDPRVVGDKDAEHGPQFDLYSLGLILLEIGLWVPLSDLWKPKYTLSDFKQRVEDVYIRRLASKCGTAYMQVVRDCFWAADRIASGAESLQNFSQLYNRIIIRLQRCCLLDEVDPSYERSELSTGASISPGPLKRKSVTPTQNMDLPSSPSLQNVKRWAHDKGSEVLERTRSLTRTTSKDKPIVTPLSRHGSQRSRGSITQAGVPATPVNTSQHSMRKSLSQLMSPKKEAAEPMDWRFTPDEKSFEASRTTSDLPLTKSITSVPSDDTNASTPSLRDYKEKITIIQKAWRLRKARRGGANTLQTLISVATPQAILGYHPQRTLPYPTPEPGSQAHTHTQTQPQINHIKLTGKNLVNAARPKMYLHPVNFNTSIVTEWHTRLLPRLERLIARALKDSDETVSIDLVAVGETAETARPTIMVTCNSVPKVKAMLERKFSFDKDQFDLRVRRGKVSRSKMNRSSHRRKLPHRSMMNTEVYSGDMAVMNPFHQQRPLCGASIGAFTHQHLPPVSYGGVVLVDDEPLGLTVHHLLDAPSDEESESDDEPVSPGAVLSSAHGAPNPWLMGMGSQPSLQLASSTPAPMWDLEISDDDMKDDDDGESYEFSDSEFDSDDEEESDDEQLVDSMLSTRTTGDIDGIPFGEGEEIKITQPAIDDVEEDFFPSEEDKDDDHLSSHELGHVYATSGIRRWKRDGITHEIDWALLKLNEERLQPYNLVQGGRRFCVNRTVAPDQREISTKLEEPINRRHYAPEEDEYPNGVASSDKLGGLNVHCFGRTTGLQGGMVGAAMSSLRIYKRKTFSRSWYVMGGFGGTSTLTPFLLFRNKS
jgi:hypothetical protein